MQTIHISDDGTPTLSDPQRLTGINGHELQLVEMQIRVAAECRELAKVTTPTIADTSYWSFLMEVNQAIMRNENSSHPAFETAVKCLVVPAGAAKTKANDARQLQANPRRRNIFERDLAEVREFFDGRFRIFDLVGDVLERGRKIVIDMASISQKDHRFVMHELMKQLKSHSVRIFKGGGQCNAIVVLDKGQRWIREGGDDDEGSPRLFKTDSASRANTASAGTLSRKIRPAYRTR